MGEGDRVSLMQTQTLRQLSCICRLYVAVGALALALIISGCASTAGGQPPSWTQGRMLLQAEATQARPALNERVSFELTGSGTQGQLRIFSPLGTTLATASWAPGQALLQTSEGEQRFADLDQLSRKALGETLPLAALPDWLAGRPWTEAPHQPTSNGFRQSGWLVNLQQQAQGWIEASRQAPPAVKLRIKLEASP